jgi:hypothetical protein
VLRITGPKRNEEGGEWRKLYGEDLHNMFSLTSISGVKAPRIM